MLNLPQIVRKGKIRSFLTRKNFYFYTLNNNELYGGLTYRNSDAIGVLLGFSPIQKFTIGYSYDITINKLASVSRGSHEIVLKYCYSIKTPKPTISRNPRFL
ncbi:MAG: type IX secretion system membrane protein PorP/SprF [Crocinitomicaceae bacterium]|nr:type IX secretion system membrane protein PorP/SprF [Crocinitomicaceae bacterium]